MELAHNILKTHSGRDLCLRTVSYACRLMSAVPNRSLAAKFLTVASETSECRTVLRLFDDIIMLRYSLSYGLGKEESDIVLRLLGIITNIIDQLYYPVEHVAWAADKHLININSTYWWDASTMMWAISMYLGIIRAFRYLYILRKNKDTKDGDSVKMFAHLTIIQNTLDMCNAIHWFPKGFLWSQQLKPWQVGLFGIASSFISIYKHLITM